MSELRKDYVLDRWVIIAHERAKRPDQFRHEDVPSVVPVDFFAPGNEHLNPPEIMRIPDENGGWKIRVFPNKFPAVTLEGDFEIKTHNKFYTFATAYGQHEVIVETPDYRQLWDLDADHIRQVLEVYHDRLLALKKLPGIKYVTIFKNHKKEGGASVVHSHSQLIAFDNVPDAVADEVDAVRSYGSCPYCEIIQRERDSFRRCFENEDYLAFCPYASRFPFELWIFPKRHVGSLCECNIPALAEILKKVLEKLKELNAPYNYVVHYSPEGEDLHFHIEVLPRLTTWAGFEYSGTIINPQPPEEAAKFYRGEIKLEE